MSTQDRRNAVIIYADSQRSHLGLPSYIHHLLAGQPVLRRTVERLQRVKSLDDIMVFCPEAQQSDIKALLSGTSAQLFGVSQPIPLATYLGRRKWSLSSWRGGIHEATVYDELRINRDMVNATRAKNIYTALMVPPEAVCVDPKLLEGLIEYHHRYNDTMRFTFTQAAPGLTCCAYRLDFLHELELAKAQVADILAYQPEKPHFDMILFECNYKVDPPLSLIPFRFLADNRRSIEVLETLLNTVEGESPSALDFVNTIKPMLVTTSPMPQELDIEITTEKSLRLTEYPHGTIRRGPMSLAQFEKICQDCRPWDDMCITIGGYGEPLSHPDLIAMIQAAKNAGILGINIETDGRLLTGKLAEDLLQAPVDVISVWLDANSPELYRQLKGEDHFEAVTANIQAFMEKSQLGIGPQVIPHLTKIRATMAEMEAFYDRWLVACGAAVIVGPNDYAGQIADLSIRNMCPPKRFACQRLSRCLTILADGSVTTCHQDFKGHHPVGNIFQKPLTEIWQGPALESLRQAHRQEQFNQNPLCAQCKEWAR